jgi:hypothetical protein
MMRVVCYQYHGESLLAFYFRINPYTMIPES